MSEITQKIIPMFWHDGTALEAAELYVSIFKDGKIISPDISPSDYPDGKQGDVITVTYELFGQRFINLNGGPHFKFNEATSMMVQCQDQAEVDEYWDKLIANGGAPSQCGWLKDKFGMSWQITPTRLDELMRDPDPERAKRAMECMMKQTKIDIAELEAAADGK